MEFLKYHALGNDYLVLTSGPSQSAETELTAEQVRKICHRNFGPVSYTHLTLPTTPYV